MNQKDSLQVAITVLDRLSWQLAEAGEVDLIPHVVTIRSLLNHMRDVVLEMPEEFPEYAVPVEPPKPSEN